MDKHHIKIRSFICLICFFFFVFLWGCDKPPEAPQQTKKVVQKITVAKTTERKAPAQPQKTDAQKPDPKKEAAKEVAAAKPKASLTDLFNPQGKLDPFEPLFQAKPIALAAKKKKRRSAPPTPLEKVSLEQLQLVAIIRTPDENKALVEEATGKGYIVKKGTYIGLNSAKIIQILKDRIVVEEEVEDVYGKVTVSKKSLKLQKSPGE